MQKIDLKELIIKLPQEITETISNNEIIDMLIDKALSKSEYFHSRCKEMEKKYNMDFTSYKKYIEELEEEVFENYDDMIRWESYYLAYNEWKHKYEVLINCRE